LLTAAINKNNNSSQTRSLKIEKWSDILTQLKIDISKPINYISAKQIKQITNEDARLMAKIDKIENLPKLFREDNLFILPVSRKEYAIVRGTGYHSLERINDLKPITYTTEIPFPAHTHSRKRRSYS
jgi:hypothetical protein